jgi:hypothetical protein
MGYDLAGSCCPMRFEAAWLGRRAARLELMRIGDGGHECTRQQRADAGDLHQPATKFGLSRTRPHPSIVLENLRFHDFELRFQHPQAEPRVSRYPHVLLVVDDEKQLLNPVSPDRRHDPKLGQMSTRRSIFACADD